MNKSTVIPLAVSVIALPLLLASTPASAKFVNTIQRTFVTASGCRPTNASNAAHMQIDRTGRIFNISPTQVLAVDCALTQEGSSAKVEVYAIDQKVLAGASITCQFRQFNPFNGLVISSSLFGTGLTASTPSKAETIGSTFMPTLGVPVLNCLIPPASADGKVQSGLSGYQLIEFE